MKKATEYIIITIIQVLFNAVVLVNMLITIMFTVISAVCAPIVAGIVNVINYFKSNTKT